MIETFSDIRTDEGVMDTFVVYPEAKGHYPAVVLYMDIWGLREELYDIARRIACVGYCCILPNTYYRHGKVRFDYRNEKGEMRSMEDLPRDVQEHVRKEMRELTDAMVVKDAKAILDFAATAPATSGTKGLLGYCMGGRHAMAVAAAYPDIFRATASLHGTRLVTDAADSPHKVISNLKGEVYCGFAERDSLAPPSTVETLARLFKEQPDVRYVYRVHEGTDHGYSLPDRDIFDTRAAHRDWEQIFPMFRRQLRT